MLQRLLLHLKILSRCDLVLSHIAYILHMQDAVTTDLNQPETLPLTKSPSSSMKSLMIFLLKFI